MNHSLGQLHLLVEAGSRLQARKALLDLQVNTAAVAASMTKEGGRFWDNLRQELLKKV